MTRHPSNGGSTSTDFSVALVDGYGNKQSIRMADYTTALFRTYRRKSSRPFGAFNPNDPPDSGFGWQNAFEVFRIRLTDFLADGSPLSLEDVRSVVFEFGGTAGTGSGRLALDDIEITTE